MSTPETKAPAESAPDGILNWILRLIPAFIIGRAAWMKFSSNPNAVMIFQSLDMEPQGRIIIAMIEATCVVLLLSRKISAWGAILCLGVMIGAVIAHVTVIGFSDALGKLFGMAIVSASASTALIYRLRHQVPFVRSMFNT